MVFLCLQWYNLGPQYAALSVGTILTYVGFTFATTKWRTKFRVAMNQADNKAQAHCIDSLINYETVKYFNNEQFEADNYSKILANYQNASLKSSQSLSALNFGQKVIFSASMAVMMSWVATGVLAGKFSHQFVFHFVFISSLFGREFDSG